MTSRDSAAGGSAVAGAAALDAALVIVFAMLGRGSHAEQLSLAGIWQTAWPFLAGLAIAWIAARAWRSPGAILRSGVPLWVGTVAIGMVLRVLFTSGGAALPFVVVATLVLGLLLVGWRALRALIVRARAKPQH